MNRIRRFLLALIVLCIVTLMATAHSFAAENATAAFDRLLRDAWETTLREFPEFATHTGDSRYNDRLDRQSLADQRRRLAQKREQLERLQAIDRNALPPDSQLNYDIFERSLRDDLAEFEFEEYLVPITNRSGFHIHFPELPKHMPLATSRDYENYIRRLQAFDQQAADHVELMREGLKKGLVLPAVVLEDFDRPIKSHIVGDPTASLLFEPFQMQNFPASVPESDRPRLIEAGKDAIAKSVVPGYRRFLEFMEKEYVPAARGTIAAAALPNGREYYRFCIRKFTTLDLSAEQVHETGLSEVKRIRAEMEAVIRKTGFSGGFREFVDDLRTNPKFYATTPEQLQKEVAYVLKRMDGELPRLFKTLPRMPYGIRPVPDYIAPRTTTAYYVRPAGDGSQAGFYFINTFDLKSRPLYEIEALSLHEAVPGHHLQIALQQELTGLPEFRRFSGFTAYIEGWALYAERLGLEVGFYADPYSDFGRLTYEMWRACRLVVDTGMHSLGWTRQQAIDFMADNTALSLHNIESEVDRYIAWPGQALAYKIGELKFRELRERAEKQLGPRFDLREFHDVVLGSGAVPLTVLEDNVNRWLQQPRQQEQPLGETPAP